MTFDGKAFGKEIVGVVKEYLAKELAPLSARIDAIEKQVREMPAPVDLSEDLAAVKATVDAIKMSEIPPAPELPDVDALVRSAVSAAVAELPKPQDGKDADLDEVRRVIADEVKEIRAAVEAIEPAPQFSDIAAMVSDAVATIPAPQDGKSVTVEEVAPLIASEVDKRISELPRAKDGKDGRDGKDGKNGIGLAGALIDRDGELFVTLTNGETKNLGPVVGKDGTPGKDGRDGFSLEEFDATLMDDGRTVLLAFERGDQSFKVELGFPVMLYRGVYKDGEKYERGDTVTWGGSLWHCDGETADKPGEGAKSWTLCAKKGRDGRDGTVKEVKTAQPVRVGVPARAD
jgi:hypothetical protein